MTTPATRRDSLHAASETSPEATQLDISDLTVLQAVMSSDQPLTVGRVAKATGLQPACVSVALEMLCAAGLVRRLNTVLVSYAVRNR